MWNRKSSESHQPIREYSTKIIVVEIFHYEWSESRSTP